MTHTVAIFFKHQSVHSSGWSQIVWIAVLVSSMTLVIIKHIIRVYFISCKNLSQIALYFRVFCSSKSGSLLKWLRYFAQVSESRSCKILKELDTRLCTLVFHFVIKFCALLILLSYLLLLNLVLIYVVNCLSVQFNSYHVRIITKFYNFIEPKHTNKWIFSHYISKWPTKSLIAQLVGTSRVQIFPLHYNYCIIEKYLLKLKIVAYQIQP